MAKEHILPIELPPRYYDAIGRVAAKWSLLELRLQAIVWHYMGIDMKKGRVLTYGLNARAKVTLLQTPPLRSVTDAKAKVEVTAIANAAERLNNRRNNFVHGVWQ